MTVRSRKRDPHDSVMHEAASQINGGKQIRVPLRLPRNLRKEIPNYQ